MSNIKINVKVKERTAMAMLVSDGLKEAWVPISQIHDATQELGKFGPEITAIVIPEWLAIDKGLKQTTQDDDTVDLFGGAS